MSYDEALAAGWRQVPPNMWQRVLTARTEAGMTVEEFAAATGLTTRIVRNYESGLSAPLGPKLRRVCEATGKSEDYFMDLDFTVPGWTNDACWPPKPGDKPSLTLIQGGLS